MLPRDHVRIELDITLGQPPDHRFLLDQIEGNRLSLLKKNQLGHRKESANETDETRAFQGMSRAARTQWCLDARRGRRPTQYLIRNRDRWHLSGEEIGHRRVQSPICGSAFDLRSTFEQGLVTGPAF